MDGATELKGPSKTNVEQGSAFAVVALLSISQMPELEQNHFDHDDPGSTLTSFTVVENPLKCLTILFL